MKHHVGLSVYVDPCGSVADSAGCPVNTVCLCVMVCVCLCVLDSYGSVADGAECL